MPLDDQFSSTCETKNDQSRKLLKSRFTDKFNSVLDVNLS